MIFRSRLKFLTSNYIIFLASLLQVIIQSAYYLLQEHFPQLSAPVWCRRYCSSFLDRLLFPLKESSSPLLSSKLGREYCSSARSLLDRLFDREDNSPLVRLTVTVSFPVSSSFFSAFLYCILKRKASRTAATTMVMTTTVNR